jgi:hexosaminidase
LIPAPASLERLPGAPLAGPAVDRELIDDPALGDEGYRLESDDGVVRLRAHSETGLFRAGQTLSSLGDPVPRVRIEDRPRYAWRGAMLDVARHFFGVAEVKRFIDLIALYKLNVLHLHLTDDQGWRIAIEGWPRLTEHGAATQVGGGPGGHYTKADYAEIVRYAGERHITVVPEIDLPGHVNAALASYPELNRDGTAPQLYTGIEVGFSSLSPELEATRRFLAGVLGELAAMTPDPYLHIGGDEAKSTSRADYELIMAQVQEIVRRLGKRVVGWEEIASVPLAADTVVQHWSDPALAHAASAQGAPLVMSPAAHAYLDMKYDADTPLGQTWAGLVEVRDAYEWDPGDALGVEAPLWSETLASIGDAEYMLLPRLPAIAEVGWSRRRGWEDFRTRLAAEAPRWEALGARWHRSPQIPWP